MQQYDRNLSDRERHRRSVDQLRALPTLNRADIERAINAMAAWFETQARAARHHHDRRFYTRNLSLLRSQQRRAGFGPEALRPQIMMGLPHIGPRPRTPRPPVRRRRFTSPSSAASGGADAPDPDPPDPFAFVDPILVAGLMHAPFWPLLSAFQQHEALENLAEFGPDDAVFATVDVMIEPLICAREIEPQLFGCLWWHGCPVEPLTWLCRGKWCWRRIGVTEQFAAELHTEGNA
jgi:hypothetical protein